MADNDPNEFVYIRLKEHGDDVPPGRVTRQAFDSIWSGKGFVIVDTQEAENLGSPATMMEMAGASNEPASTPTGEAATTTRKRG